MKKPCFLPLLLSAVLLLSGCDKGGEESSEPMSNAVEENSNTDENSTASSAQPPAESAPELVPVEFTDEDLELQALLIELQEPVEEILHWYFDMVPPPPELEIAFPQFGSDSVTHYVRIPDNFRAQDELSSFVMPTTRNDMRKIMLQYFSEEFTEKYMRSNIAVGTMVKNSDGTYSAALTENVERFAQGGFSTFAELNGRLYRFNVIKPIPLDIDYDTVKITEKTEDSIKFSYLPYSIHYRYDLNYEFEPYYSEYAFIGSLKYERGGWKLESFGVPYNRESNIEDPSTNSSDQNISDPVPVEFTDEDRELQEILSGLTKPAHEIHSWLIDLVPSAPFTEFKFPQLGDNDRGYFGVIPENCYWTDPEFTIPTTCARMEELMLKYFSEARVEGFMNNIVPGNLTENPDGTFDVTFDDEVLTKLYVINDRGNFYIRPKFIEADGKFYRAEGSSIRVLTIIEDSAKVISRTEDTIEFSHINGLALYGSDPEPDYNTEPFYSENAVKGVLKYERGGWKIDSWED